MLSTRRSIDYFFYLRLSDLLVEDPVEADVPLGDDGGRGASHHLRVVQWSTLPEGQVSYITGQLSYTFQPIFPLIYSTFQPLFRSALSPSNQSSRRLIYLPTTLPVSSITFQPISPSADLPISSITFQPIFCSTVLPSHQSSHQLIYLPTDLPVSSITFQPIFPSADLQYQSVLSPSNQSSGYLFYLPTNLPIS